MTASPAYDREAFDTMYRIAFDYTRAHGISDPAVALDEGVRLGREFERAEQMFSRAKTWPDREAMDGRKLGEQLAGFGAPSTLDPVEATVWCAANVGPGEHGVTRDEIHRRVAMLTAHASPFEVDVARRDLARRGIITSQRIARVTYYRCAS